MRINRQGTKLTGARGAKLCGAAAARSQLAICPWVHANDALAQFLRQQQAVSWRDKSLSGMSLPQFPLTGKLGDGQQDNRRKAWRVQVTFLLADRHFLLIPQVEVEPHNHFKSQNCLLPQTAYQPQTSLSSVVLEAICHQGTNREATVAPFLPHDPASSSVETFHSTATTTPKTSTNSVSK